MGKPPTSARRRVTAKRLPPVLSPPRTEDFAMKLAGKTALITGAAGAIAGRFVSEGALVAVADLKGDAAFASFPISAPSA
jgi:hypothetical protein